MQDVHVLYSVISFLSIVPYTEMYTELKFIFAYAVEGQGV